MKPMNKSGSENQGEKKMLTRTFYGEKGAVQYAVAPAPQLVNTFSDNGFLTDGRPSERSQLLRGGESLFV